MLKLAIYAGKDALKTLQQEGIHNHLFSHFLGASGGPKWFSHYGLDQYLIGEFFSNRQTPLQVLGSSAGAFIAACLALKDPGAALAKLACLYSETCYPKGASPKQVSLQTRDLIDQVFGPEGGKEIINNPLVHAHFVAAKCCGLGASDHTLTQLAGMVGSYVKNRFGRQYIKHDFERVIFQAKHSQLSLTDPAKIPTHYQELTLDNIKDALLASCSIPLFMQGIRNIPNAPTGCYRDGGLLDYHFDLNFHNEGLILYPHFDAAPKAGWFDKSLSRTPKASHYDKTVMLCPTPEFIESFPFGKIPDRKDFTQLGDKERIGYWKNVMKMTEALADEMDDVVQKQDMSRIQPLALAA